MIWKIDENIEIILELPNLISDFDFDIIKLHLYTSPVFFVFVTELPLKSIIIRFYFDVSVKNASFCIRKDYPHRFI